MSSILKKLSDGWKAKTTEEKVNFVLTIVANIGTSLCFRTINDKLCENKNVLEKVCIRTATYGLSLAATKVSSDALQETVGKSLVNLIDMNKPANSEEQEGDTDE